MSDFSENSGSRNVSGGDPAMPLAGVDTVDIEALVYEHRQLQEQYQRCSQALATAAHDLRTPLAVVSGYIELLMSGKLGDLNDRQQRVLHDMQSSSSRLQRLITDFLTFSALETGTLSLRLEDDSSLHECLLEICGFWLPRFQAKEIAFYCLGTENIRPFMFDRDRIQRVVSNLLENALKFTPSGGTVWLNAEMQMWERRVADNPASYRSDRRSERTSTPNAVRITVADTGRGIPPEYHQDIFCDFFQVPDERESNDGMGLGLGIARRLVHAHGGKLWVESDPGNGCKFSFLVPLRQNRRDE